MRKKHFSNWLFYLNVLGDWSSEYRFFLIYNKSNLNLNFFKHTYVTFNLMAIKTKVNFFVKNLFNLKGSSSPKFLTHYFFKNNTDKMHLSFIKNVNILFLNSLTPIPTTESSTLKNFYALSGNSLFSPTLPTNQSFDFSLLHKLNFVSLLVYSKELYKILILIQLFHLNK